MERRGIGKQQLAEIAGVGPSAVTKWANGGAIRRRHLLAIENHFGVSLLATASENDPRRLLVRHAVCGALYRPAAGKEPSHPLCHFPVDCDMVARLDAQQAALDELRVQMQTLLQLLGAPLRQPVPKARDGQQKAG